MLGRAAGRSFLDWVMRLIWIESSDTALLACRLLSLQSISRGNCCSTESKERLAMREAVGTEQAKQWIIFAKNQQSSTWGHSQLNTGYSVRKHEVSIIVYRSGMKESWLDYSIRSPVKNHGRRSSRISFYAPTYNAAIIKLCWQDDQVLSDLDVRSAGLSLKLRTSQSPLTIESSTAEWRRTILLFSKGFGLASRGVDVGCVSGDFAICMRAPSKIKRLVNSR